MTRDSSEYNVRAIERAFEILNCFDDAHPARGITEIAHAVGLHKATTHRIVTTLTNHGYLERLPESQEYRLGMQLADLGFRIIRRMDLRREALPFMTQVAQQCEETCDLSVFDRGEVLVVEVIRSRHGHTLATAVGQHLPIHATANGKLFLAHLLPAQSDALLSRPLAGYTKGTITSPEQLRTQLELIRRQGYGFDDEEFEVGVRAAAAPIRNSDGAVVAALGMPGPTGRIPLERLPEIAGLLMEAAQSISRRIGWRP